MKINLYVSRAWYWPHVASVWHALDPAARGTVYTPPMVTLDHEAKRHGITVQFGMPPADELTIVVSGNDLNVAKRCILLDHGVGQSYVGVSHQSWAGGDDRGNCALFCVPNEQAAAKNRERYPDIPNAVVGSPHVEWLRTLPREPIYEATFSRHWGPALVPEMNSAWWHHEAGIAALTPAWNVALHCHPRQADEGRRCAQIMGLPYLARFEDVVRHSEMYATDNSSTLFEAAALDIPVLVLNDPRYRREVEHGLRFWSAIPGLQCDDPADIADSLAALRFDDAQFWQERRALVTAEVFPIIDGAAKMAAEAIMEIL